MTDLPIIGFIGAGRAAGAIALALQAAGYRIAAVASRTPDSAARLAQTLIDCKTTTAQAVADSADLVLITTPDAVIADVAQEMHWRQGQAVVHCSGAQTLVPLMAARDQGAAVGSWHPVQTFTGNTTPGVMEGTTVGIEASDALSDTLADMAHRVGAVPLPVPPDARPLYHAAAVMSCGYVTTLLHEAIDLWQRAGLPEEAARNALTKLAATTVANVREFGASAALTGPAARGDIETMRLHLRALDSAAPDLSPLYRVLAGHSAALGGVAGQDSAWQQIVNPPLEEK